MYASLSSTLNQIGAIMSKDKDNDDIIEIKHHKKIEGEPLYVDADAFGPEETVEIGEYDLICLEREQENLRRLQIYLLTEKKMTIEEVHDLQDTKIEYLLLDLINFQKVENEDLNEELEAEERGRVEMAKRWRAGVAEEQENYNRLKEFFIKTNLTEFKKYEKKEKKRLDALPGPKDLLQMIRERKFD